MAPALIARTLTCGKCGGTATCATPANEVEPVRVETDFRPVYSGINPLHYLIAVCKACRFAAYFEDFDQIAIEHLEGLRDALAGEARQTMASDSLERSLFHALRSFQLAMVCYGARAAPAVTLAGLNLRAAWISREGGQMGRELGYLDAARGWYLKAQAAGDRHDLRLGGLNTSYLIGELSFRLGDFEEAQDRLSAAATLPDKVKATDKLARDRLTDLRQARADRDALGRSALFGSVPREALGLLVAGSRRLDLHQGDPVCRKGDSADALYLVESGCVRVMAEDDPHRPVATVGPGEVLGEFALLAGGTRTAAMLAGDGRSRDEAGAVVLRIDRGAFRHVLQRDPTVVEALETVMARRHEENVRKGVLTHALPAGAVRKFASGSARP